MRIGKTLGNSFFIRGNRVFKTITINGKKITKLVTWSQRRCERCKKFLSKRQKKYCKKCSYIVYREDTLKSRRKPLYREEGRLRAKVEWHADSFNVGDLV